MGQLDDEAKEMRVVESDQPAIKTGTHVSLSVAQFATIVGSVLAAGSGGAGVLFSIKSEISEVRRMATDTNATLTRAIDEVHQDVSKLDDKINFEPLSARMNTMSERLLRIEKQVWDGEGR